MIARQRLDAVNLKLAAIKEQVKVKDVDKLCSRNEFDKYKVCSPVTYYKYAKGLGTDEDLAEQILHELSKILKARNVDVDSILKELNS